MSSFPSACKTVHVSPASSEHTCDAAGMDLSHVTHDHGQMPGPELSLIEMSEVDYIHLQHLIQAQMEGHVTTDTPDGRSHPAAASSMDKDDTVTSPYTSAQAVDLSASTDDHCVVMPGEKTPATYGEVPGFVLARVIDADSPSEPSEPSPSSCTSSHKRARSSARVRLEERFNALSPDTPRQQDIQSAVLSNFLVMLQQSAEAQWVKTDRANPFEVSSPYVGTVTNTYEQVIGHIPHEPNKHPSLIIPKSFPFIIRQEMVVTNAHHTSDVGMPAAFRKHGSTHSSQPINAASAAPDTAGESESSSRKTARTTMSRIQRREIHNLKERERRRRIRSYCDELNMLVPFCEPDTDKATTLQWTSAFLRYLNQMYGDTFKEEFEKTFADEKGHFHKTSPSSGQDPIHEKMDDTLSSPLAVEQ